MKISDKIKNVIYKSAYSTIRAYWRIFKPKTFGSRILLVTESKILLVQPRTLHYWNLPGGGIKKSENPEQGGLRELYEETGIKINSVDYLLGTYTSSDEGKCDTIYFYVKKVEQELVTYNDMEIGNSDWFSFNELPEQITGRTKMRIQEYLAGKKNIQGLYKELHTMNNQIIKTLPKSAWQDVVIGENNERLVEVVETEKLIYGSQFGPWENNNSYYLREIVAHMLYKASEILPSGYKLAIVEGVRSIEKQQEHWNRKFEHFSVEHPEWSTEEIEHQTALVVARPAPLANHNCGGAVDVALAYNNVLVDMGTKPQALAEKKIVEMFSELITDEQMKNRAILREAMESVGFVWYPGEWWHFCYGDRMWAVYTNRKECMYGPIQNIK